MFFRRKSVVSGGDRDITLFSLVSDNKTSFCSQMNFDSCFEAVVTPLRCPAYEFSASLVLAKLGLPLIVVGEFTSANVRVKHPTIKLNIAAPWAPLIKLVGKSDVEVSLNEYRIDENFSVTTALSAYFESKVPY